MYHNGNKQSQQCSPRLINFFLWSCKKEKLNSLSKKVACKPHWRRKLNQQNKNLMLIMMFNTNSAMEFIYDYYFIIFNMVVLLQKKIRLIWERKSLGLIYIKGIFNLCSNVLFGVCRGLVIWNLSSWRIFFFFWWCKSHFI